VSRSALAFLFAVVLAATGCTSVPTGIGVNVETATRRGRGVVIGPHTILTVCHVVSGSDDCEVDGMPARVVQRHVRSTETGEDGIAVVELVKDSFPPERIGTLCDKVGAGVVYLPARGETPWPWGLQPGDSGSPILDAKGHVTGLVRAVYGRAEPLDRGTVVVTSSEN
jgi:hypothetical protein